MSDDKKISQLISKSLRYNLTDQENEEVKEHLKTNDESRKFENLSSLIQKSAVLAAEQVNEDRDMRLSSQARQKMKSSVSSAILEVASLSSAGLINQGETMAISSSTTATSSELPANQSRQLNSHFRLIRKLGDGGLGNVWLARDEKLNRTVAIKELKSDALESPLAWQRFHREAEITGHLEHPNVVPLYQFGEDKKTGEPFYAMRFVGKRTLADAIVEHHDRVNAGQDCSMGIHRLLSVFVDVCQAIAYAHSRGVIHRDLKPENVALDSFGQVIVLDWGLARVVEDGELANKMSAETVAGNSQFGKTIHGDVVGTPVFMAPEQALGDPNAIDFRTDVYGLGAILFAMLTGRAPHENLFTEGSISAALKKLTVTEAPKPSSFGIPIPHALEAICVKAMNVKPHLRFESVQELADAVERWIAGQSGKKAAYENLRMEGRELRADLQSTVRDLERNVRFMSSLPPIQELIHCSTEEETNVWRERLSMIFRGLLQANPSYQNVTYCRLDDDQFTELVRLERQQSEIANIRSIPKSRLRSDKVSDYIVSVAKRKPGEVLTSLVCDPMCERAQGCIDTVGLVVGVPIFDDKTEELFGFVMINCNIEMILRQQMTRRLSAEEVVVACDVFHIMMHKKSGHISEETLSQPVKEQAAHFLPALEHLQTNLEFIDSTNSEIYGARLWFIPDKHGVVFLLKRSQNNSI